MDGLISGFGEQACFCHSDAAGCGAEKREADRQQAQEEEEHILLGLLEGWGPVKSWLWGQSGGLGEFWPLLARLSFLLPKCNSVFFVLTLKVIKVFYPEFVKCRKK